jgi:hypothetical protein
MEFGQPVIWQSYVMGSAAVVLIAGVVLGWFREKAGGILLIVAGLAFAIWSYFEAGHNKWFAFMISGFPYFITGMLFLISGIVFSEPE